MRRDFTVNAIFYNLKTKEIEDLTGKGLKDLKKGIIRTPIDPKTTFKDDPLRILRAIRFKNQLNFEYDQKIIDLFKNDEKNNFFLISHLQNKVSRERVNIEFKKILSFPSSRFLIAFLDILSFNLFPTIFLNLDDKNFSFHFDPSNLFWIQNSEM